MALANRNYIHGNTAPSPQFDRKAEEEKRRLRESKKRFLESQQKQTRQRRKVHIKTLSAILGVASIFGLTIYRSTVVFEIQKQYVDLQKATTLLRKDNESLDAIIIKMSGIDGISKQAEAIGLVRASAVESIVIDLDKNNFKEEVITEETQVNPLAKLFTLNTLKP